MEKLYSILSDNNMYYISVHAECALRTYSPDFYENVKSEVRKMHGIYRRTLDAEVLRCISNYPYEAKDICMDFEWIEDMTDNNCSSLCSFISSCYERGRTVYILNICGAIRKMISNRFEEKCGDNYESEMDFIVIGTKREESYETLVGKMQQCYNNHIAKMVLEAREVGKTKRHASVPVYLTNYINVKEMIKHESEFFRYCIYRIAADMRRREIFSAERWSDSNPCFFFHTLNGCYIATQLADLCQTDMVYLDHLGPIEAICRKHFEKSIRDGKSYVIVADVICLEGEIGRAKTIIEYFGGKIVGEVCIVDIKTVQEDNPVNRCSLYTVSKENNEIEYKITTDLS